jgi:hypothetical protein
MKFRSIWRKPQYVVRPGWKEIVAPGQERIFPALRAQFREGGWPEGGFLDTEDEQRRLGWTDEQREQVEQHLLKHSDFGIGIFLAEEPPAVIEEESDRGCAFVTVTEDAAERCGKRRAKGQEYCPKHAKLLEGVSA